MANDTLKREEKPPDSASTSLRSDRVFSVSASPAGTSSGTGTIDDPIIISEPENTPQSQNTNSFHEFLQPAGQSSSFSFWEASITPPRGRGRNVNSGHIYSSVQSQSRQINDAVGQRGYISSNLHWQQPNRSPEDGTLNLLRAMESERIETRTNSNRAEGQSSRSRQELDGSFLSLGSLGTANDTSERSLKQQMDTFDEFSFFRGSNATNIHQVASLAGPSQAGQSATTETRIASQLQSSPTPSGLVLTDRASTSTRQTDLRQQIITPGSYSGARQPSSTVNQNALRRQNSHPSSLGPRYQHHQGPTDRARQQRAVSQHLPVADMFAETLHRNRLLQQQLQYAQNAPPMPRPRATGPRPVSPHQQPMRQPGNKLEPVGYACLVCKLDMSLTPEGSVARPGDYPDTAVLLCGHAFHCYCLERTNPPERAHDPGCPVCAAGKRHRP